MAAVILTGHGGLEKLEYRTDWPVPRPASGQVLLEVLAAGVNNTDIKTRIGWYSKPSLRPLVTADWRGMKPSMVWMELGRVSQWSSHVFKARMSAVVSWR